MLYVNCKNICCLVIGFVLFFYFINISTAEGLHQPVQSTNEFEFKVKSDVSPNVDKKDLQLNSKEVKSENKDLQLTPKEVRSDNKDIGSITKEVKSDSKDIQLNPVIKNSGVDLVVKPGAVIDNKDLSDGDILFIQKKEVTSSEHPDFVKQSFNFGVFQSLMQAKEKNYEKIDNYFKQNKAEINKPVVEGNTFLVLSAMQNDYVGVDLALKNGANLWIKNKDNDFALHWAAFYGNEAMLNDLMVGSNDLKKYINQKDKNGATPLLFSIMGCDCDRAVTLLLKNGADVNAVDNKGRSAAHVAAAKNHGKQLVVLLSNGANSMLKDDDGDTVEDVIVRRMATENKILIKKFMSVQGTLLIDRQLAGIYNDDPYYYVNKEKDLK